MVSCSSGRYGTGPLFPDRSQLRIAGIREDTTDVLGAVGDLDVSIVAPTRSPGIPHNEGVTVITDHCDTMVELLSTCGRVDDATLVMLEDGLVGLDGNGDDTHVGG